MATPTIPAPQPYQWTFRRVVGATLVFSFVAFCFYLLFRFYEVVFILFISVVIGTVLRPVSNWLTQRGFSRMASVILIYLAIFVFLAGFLWLLFPLIFKQGATILGEVPLYYQGVRTWLAESHNQLFQRLGGFLPSSLPNIFSQVGGDQNIVSSAETAMGYVTIAARVIFTMIVILALTLYWTLDGPRIIRSLLLLVPRERRESTGDLITAMEASVGSFIVGQGLLCLSIGVMAFIAYLLIGLPNAFVLAITAGLFEAVPMVGPLLGAIPASLMALSISPDKFIWVVIASFIIQQAEGTLLVPRIMGRTVGVNPFVTLLAIFAFSSLFGIGGALMAIPMAAVIQLVLNHFVFQQPTVELEPSEGRDYPSRLRYEAQDLIQDLRKQARHKKRGTDEKIEHIEQVMDEIETITESLDTLLAQANQTQGVE